MKDSYPDLQFRILLCRMQRLMRWQFPNLSAPHWRLYWNTTGGGHVRLSGKDVELLPDRMYVIPPDTPYGSFLEHPLDHFYLHFTIRSGWRAGHDRLYSFPAEPLLVQAAREIATLSGLKRHALRVGLLARLLAHAAVACVPDDALRTGYDNPHVDSVVAFMEDNLARVISNEELADQADMHPNSMVRLFRRITAQTPQAYLARLRVERACELLLRTEASIEEIAQSTGFCDRYHFTRVFRRQRGLGPAAFRRSHLPHLDTGETDK